MTLADRLALGGNRAYWSLDYEAEQALVYLRTDMDAPDAIAVRHMVDGWLVCLLEAAEAEDGAILPLPLESHRAVPATEVDQHVAALQDTSETLHPTGDDDG